MVKKVKPAEPMPDRSAQLIQVTGQLLSLLREADRVTLERYQAVLADYNDGWLRDGTMPDWPGTTRNVLADTDTTMALYEATGILLESLD